MDDGRFPWIMSSLGLVIVVCILVTVWYARRWQQERRRQEAEFIDRLTNAFANATLTGVADLTALYDAHFRHHRVAVEIYRHILWFLHAVQLRIASSPTDGPEHGLLPRLDELRKLMVDATRSLEAEERRVPFYGTPDPERGLLEDILELTNADRTIVTGKLMSLAALVTTRQDTIDKLGEEKGAARRLAYWGLAGSVVFGTISVILGIMTLRR